MNAGRDFLLFIFFLVILGVAWFMTGGPGRSISHAGWFLTEPLGSSGVSIPSVSTPTGSSSASRYQSQNPQTSVAQNIWNYFFTYHPGVGSVPTPDQSPYAPYVSLDASQAQSSDPSTEYLTIRTSQNLPNSLTISGWTLENVSTGVSVIIGNAAVIPFLGQVNSETPISVGPNATVIVTTGQAPSGSSFRVNECTGYFSQFQTFAPHLPQECPEPSAELLLHASTLAGDTACQQYVDTLSQCTLALNALPPALSASCQDFILNDLSYNGCVTEHKGEPDFYRNEWRVFLGRTAELWNNDHDVIWLLDENGRLISEVSY